MSAIRSINGVYGSSSRLSVKLHGVHHQVHLIPSSTWKCQQGFSFTAKPAFLSLTVVTPQRIHSRNNKIVSCNSSLPSGVPAPSGAPSHSWRGWMIGMVLSVLIPFWRHKWGPLLAFKKEVDMVMDTVETVAEVVEKVAEKVEDVADNIADRLPVDGKFTAAVRLVESIAKETAKDAHLADQLIEKVEEVEDRVENFFESAMDQDQTGDVTKDVGGDHEQIVEHKQNQ